MKLLVGFRSLEQGREPRGRLRLSINFIERGARRHDACRAPWARHYWPGTHEMMAGHTPSLALSRYALIHVLIRLVRMTFRPEAVDTFLSVFDESSPRIRAYPGCRHLELWQDANYPNIFTTISHWENDAALERYRSSSLFTATWARTKPLFAARPEALSHVMARGHPAD